MRLPGFAAEASMYKTNYLHRGSSGINGVDAALVHAAQTGGSCEQACANQWNNCEEDCLVYIIFGFQGWLPCHVKCLIDNYRCEAGCDSGGGGGPVPCCPLGTNCKCGGACVPGKGCVGGQCLGPHEQCN